MPGQRFARGAFMIQGMAATIKASGAETTSTTGPAFDTGDNNSAHVEINVTAVSGTGPTMTIVIEGSNDGTNWYTLGTFGANGYSMGSVGTAPSNFTATAGPIRGIVPLPEFIRYRSVIAGTSPSFTYTVNIEET